MTDQGARSRRGLDFGRVLSDAFNAVRGDPAGLAVIFVVVLIAPSAVLIWLNYRNTAPGAVPGLNPFENIVASLTSLAYQVMAIRVMVDRLRGQATTHVEAMSRGGSRFLTLFLAGLLSGLGIVLGLIVFIAPGVFLALMWAVVGPVAVMERRGIVESLTRSAELTETHRLVILGIYVVTGVVVLGGAVVAGIAWYMLMGESWERPLASAIFESTVGAIGVVAFTAVSAALYNQLVDLKHGLPRETVASVFD